METVSNLGQTRTLPSRYYGLQTSSPSPGSSPPPQSQHLVARHQAGLERLLVLSPLAEPGLPDGSQASLAGVHFVRPDPGVAVQEQEQKKANL